MRRQWRVQMIGASGNRMGENVQDAFQMVSG
jgi:hypothetical protein